MDAEGFIWSAEWYGGCVCRYDPDGTLERRIAVPAKQTSSLAFGGPDLRDIFITSAATLGADAGDAAWVRSRSMATSGARCST